MRHFLVFVLLAFVGLGVSFGRGIDSAPSGNTPISGNARNDVSTAEFPNVLFSRQQLSDVMTSRAPPVVSARLALSQRVFVRQKSMKDDRDIYKGCRLDVYTKKLTYEHGSASRDAADFAIYAAIYPDARGKLARQSAADILTGWADIADYLQIASNNGLSGFCDATGKFSQDARFAVGLTFGRAVPDLVVAYEMLRDQNALTSFQIRKIEHFFNVLYSVELMAMNYRAKYSNLDCNRFNNHVSVQISALAMLAAVTGNYPYLRGIASGSDGKLSIPLSLQLSKAIYFDEKSPLKCFSNYADPALYYQFPSVENGEIVDRYRAKPNQTFGYPMFSLEHMALAELILERKGITLEPARRKRLLVALHYYGDLLTQSQSGNGLADSFRQYRGKDVFNGRKTTEDGDFMLNSFILGFVLFPEDEKIRALILSYAAREGGFKNLPSIYLPLLAEFFENE